MNSGQNHQNPPEPEKVPKKEIPPEIQRAIESYAEAVNAGKSEEVDEAALKILLFAAKHAMAHPTPELELGEQADRCLRSADWAGAEAVYRKILEVQEQTGNPALVVKPRIDLSQLFRLLGRLDDARELARTATDSARKVGMYPLTAMALRNEIGCAMAQRKPDEALAAASEALQLIEPGKIADLIRAQAYIDHAECLLAVGRTEAAEKDLSASWEILEAGAWPRIGNGPVIAMAKWHEVQAQRQLRLGALEEALPSLEKAIEHRQEGITRSDDPSPYALAALARNFEMLAEMRKQAGDTSGQEQAVSEARALWEKIRLPRQAT